MIELGYWTAVYEHFDFPFGLQTPGPIQLKGIGMSLIIRLCAELRVKASRAGAQLDLVFRNGALVSRTRSLADAAGSWNRIAGRVARPGAPTWAIGERRVGWLSPGYRGGVAGQLDGRADVKT